MSTSNTPILRGKNSRLPKQLPSLESTPTAAALLDNLPTPARAGTTGGVRRANNNNNVLGAAGGAVPAFFPRHQLQGEPSAVQMLNAAAPTTTEINNASGGAVVLGAGAADTLLQENSAGFSGDAAFSQTQTSTASSTAGQGSSGNTVVDEGDQEEGRNSRNPENLLDIHSTNINQTASSNPLNSSKHLRPQSCFSPGGGVVGEFGLEIGDTTTTAGAAFGAGGGGGFMFGLHGAGGAGHQFLHHNSQDDAPDEVLAQQRKEKLLRTGTLPEEDEEALPIGVKKAMKKNATARGSPKKKKPSSCGVDGKINDHSRRVSEDYNTTINSYSMISSSPSNKGRGPALSTTEAGSTRIRVSARNRSSAALLAARLCKIIVLV
ncbi:unnamed protein product [Amoebophrya sp. A120]|nr:unnamed protein product [Amoebophrya sp. A120]|eukprot:GSA120T00010072001.1